MALTSGKLCGAAVEPTKNITHASKSEVKELEPPDSTSQESAQQKSHGKEKGNPKRLTLAELCRKLSKQTSVVPDITDAGGKAAGYKKSGSRLIHYLSLERTKRMLNAARNSLRLQTRKPKPTEFSDQIATVSLDNLLSRPNMFLLQDDIPAQLKEHISNAVTMAKESPELGFAVAASLCDQWDSPAQSEHIFSELIKTCQQLSRGRGLEMTMVMFRSFIQKLKSEELHRRAQLRIGRLYYENGEFGKAVVELDLDQNVKEPSDSYSLAGLVKAMALIRLGRSAQALSLLEWVATYSQDVKQQARAAFLIGRINLVYNRHDLARKWLKKVAYELADQTHCEQARKLLSQIPENLQ